MQRLVGPVTVPQALLIGVLVGIAVYAFEPASPWITGLLAGAIALAVLGVAGLVARRR